MPTTPAPFHEAAAGGPPLGVAYWVETSDELRIRVGLWKPQGSVLGTVLLFPGRTEYIEKYAQTAGELAARGYATLAIDWRGQGLADRLLDDRRIGHVQHFPDYQKDIAAMLRAARGLDLPRPFHLLAHSMGGAIGLRAVMEGLPVQSCAFSGPMWGIHMSPWSRPLAVSLANLGPVFGIGTHLMPSTSYQGYVLEQEFDGNQLTTDPDMYQMMRDQLTACPDLGIGGPSLIWLRESLAETRLLAGRASPDIPCLTFLGTAEKIVDTKAIHSRMEKWPRGTLELVPGAEHEVLMEGPDTRKLVFDRLVKHFAHGRD